MKSICISGIFGIIPSVRESIKEEEEPPCHGNPLCIFFLCNKKSELTCLKSEFNLSFFLKKITFFRSFVGFSFHLYKR